MLVPPDARVHLTGASVLGERSVGGTSGGGPEVHVRGIAVLASVKVSPGDSHVPAAGSPRPEAAAGRRAETVGSLAGLLARRVATGLGAVLVPNGARVDTSGVTVFGSMECKAACSPGNAGPVVDVRSIGGFGSVTIKTKSEADRDRDDD